MKDSTSEKSRRQKIISSARELFLKNGYRQTSIEQIAGNAGYSKRTVYLEYSSKDDLFLDIATDGLEILYESLKMINGQKISLATYISRYLETLTDFSFEQRGYFKLLASDVSTEVIENSSNTVKKRAAAIEKAGVKLLADQINNAISSKTIRKNDPWETSEIIIGSAVGIIILSIGGSQTILSQNRLKTKVKQMGQIIYRGLAQ